MYKLQEWVFQKVSWKTNKCKLIITPNWIRKTTWLLINNKINHERIRVGGDYILRKIFFKVSTQNFCHHITWCQNSCGLSTNHNPEFRCVICTSIILYFLHWCYAFLYYVKLELCCCQPIIIKLFFYVILYYYERNVNFDE